MRPEEMFDRLGIKYITEGHEHARSGWIQIECPYCSPMTGPGHWRMGYNVHGGYVNCWQCGRAPLLQALVDASGARFHDVKELVSGVDRPRSRMVELKPIGRLILPGGRGPLHREHKRYLTRRGFDPEEVVRLWGVEGIGPGWSLAWRLFIPIHYGDEIVSWTTRAIGKSILRYRSAKLQEEKLHHKDLLYGEHYCRHTVVVCEGPLDAWAIGPGAVATFGTAIGVTQLRRIANYPAVVLCLDAERAAQRKAQAILAELAVLGCRAYNVVFETGKDASRADKKEILELRRRFLS